jgi:two-component system, NarL family, nitrate/nitrite response regulator NarL
MVAFSQNGGGSYQYEGKEIAKEGEPICLATAGKKGEQKAMDTVNMLLVESDLLLREGLKILLKDSVFSVCHESEDLQHAAAQLRSGASVDLLLIDLSCPLGDAMPALAEIRSMAPSAKTVVLIAGPMEDHLLFKAMEMGINGLLLKNISSQALVRSLHLAALGEQVFPVHTRFLRPSEISAAPTLSDSRLMSLNLSSREQSILKCLTNGQSNKSIARELNLTEATVKAHVKSIMRKINAENRTQAAIWGIANGIERARKAVEAP